MTIKTIDEALKLQRSILEEAKSLNTKLMYAFKDKNYKSFRTLLDKELNKPLEDKRLELALVDKNGAVLQQDGKFQYDKEGLKELKSFTDSLLNKEVEFDFYKVDFKDLSELEVSVFYIKDLEEFTQDVDLEIYSKLDLFIKNLPPYETIK